jgi:hypothetical protein
MGAHRLEEFTYLNYLTQHAPSNLQPPGLPFREAPNNGYIFKPTLAIIGRNELGRATTNRGRQSPPEGCRIPPFAICSNSECSYCADLKEDGRWDPHLGIVWCPQCKCRGVFHCAVCYSPFSQAPDLREPKCASCQAPLRRDMGGTASESEATPGTDQDRGRYIQRRAHEPLQVPCPHAIAGAKS